MSDPELEIPPEHLIELFPGEISPTNVSKKAGPPIAGRENPLKKRELVNALIQVIIEESENGISPSLGEPHRWSAEFLQKYRDEGVPLFSKLLVALGSGLTWIYLPTDREAELMTWLLAQKPESVTIPDLFRASYRLNRGDVYLTLLTIENCLARHWRFPGREKLPQTRRLTPITSGYNYAADKFGTWYHFFGVLLEGYVSGGIAAGIVGRVESLGSAAFSGLSRYFSQKAWINAEGGAVGARLRKALVKKAHLKRKSNPRYLRPDYYLNRSEDFRDRLPVTPDPAIEATMLRDERGRLDGLSVVNRVDSLADCKVELIYDFGFGLDGRRMEIKRRIDFPAGEPVYLRGNDEEIRAVRGFISGCGKDVAFEARP